MALFEGSAGIKVPQETDDTAVQDRDSISSQLWSQVGDDKIAGMSEQRKASLQSTIDKLTAYKMEEAGITDEPEEVVEMDLSKNTDPSATPVAIEEPQEVTYGQDKSGNYTKTQVIPEDQVIRKKGEDLTDPYEMTFSDPQSGTPPAPEPDPNQRTTTIGGEDYNPPAIVPPLDNVNTADEPVAESTVLGVNTASLKRSQAISGIYEGLVNAETSTALGLIGEDEWWKRTGSNGGAAEGSSAFGPAQITKGLFKEVQANPKKFGATAEEMQALEFYIMQGEEYLKYGNESDREGYTSEFDYSMDENNKSPGTLGSGYFSGTDEANKVLEAYGGEEYLKKAYRTIAEKILGHYYDKTEGDVTKIQNYWRYGEKGSKTKSIAVNDPEYAVRYKG